MNESTIMNYFKAISAIPRASFNEKGMHDYLVNFANERGLKVISDAMWNVIIFKPASTGYENAPSVMLQGHTDMVAEKDSSSDHNFDTDGLELYEEDGFLKAKGTTLGADNGVAVAYMLALLDDKHAEHPALECVFTVQEETGLTGAEKIDVSMLESRLVIGLDSSGESEIYVSSCGGARAVLNRDVTFENKTMKTVTVAITGLFGGHSGGEIDKERGNANKIAGILMYRAAQLMDVRVVAFAGGDKMNAITREATFTLAVEDIQAFKDFYETATNEFKLQYAASDAGLAFSLTEGETEKVLDIDASRAVITSLFMLPYGVIQMSKDIEGLVITSSNIGKVTLTDTTYEVQMSIRATQAFVKDTVLAQVDWIGRQCGMQSEFSAKYPGWMYDPQSKFREHTERAYRELRGEAMKHEATHGGMELGIWSDKLPGSDIVSFGPIMYDIHTPLERLDIGSFERTYEFLVVLLEGLNNY